MRRAWFFIVLLGLAGSLGAKPRDIPIPVRQGNLDVGQFTAAVCSQLHLPAWRLGGEINLHSPRGAAFVVAVNSTLGAGCELKVNGDAAVLRVDPDKLPKSCEAFKRALRVYTAEMSPEATAAQARDWGLRLPERVDPARPLIVLLHGLDGDRSDCMPVAQLLCAAGYQVAYFSYPGDQSIRDSAAMFARDMRRLRQAQPKLLIDVIAHSMGGLVARDYVEGPQYAGGIGRLILVAPPNHGSSWARMRFLLSLQENYHLYESDPDWHWTWLITEGLGEAGGELLPGSDFLRHLNARPRRNGVKYTIVAGNRSRADVVEAGWVESCSQVIPLRARGWWGFHYLFQKMQGSAHHLRTETGGSDGPVTLHSAKLRAVSDFVVLPGDHVSLYMSDDGKPPKAWDVIKDRLARK